MCSISTSRSRRNVSGSSASSWANDERGWQLLARLAGDEVTHRRKPPSRRPSEEPLHERDGAVDLPIDGVLDLHTFHPRDVAQLLPDYIAECLKTGILTVRVIHGKGTGSLRESVHAILRRIPEVVSFRLAGDQSGWGATICELRPPNEASKGGD